MHGVSRSTRDLDVLVTALDCLASELWAPLERGGATVDVRRGDADDPLAGAVRIARPGASPVDVIVGRAAWQHDVLDRARASVLDGADVPVAPAADLILLKLYAAGPADAWDVEQLLAAGDRPALVAEVEATPPLLPDDSRRLWARIVGPR